MLEALSYEFMQNALMAGLLASIICGIIGALVVVNRVVLLAGGVAHASYGGVGLAFYLGLPMLPVTAAFAVCAALLMALVTMRVKERADTFIGVMWAAGMALGIILLDITPGYNVDLMSYLFGGILATPKTDLMLMGGLAAFVLLVVFSCYKGFWAMSFDEEFARSRGVPVTLLYFVMLALIALSVVMVIRVVGLILVIALLTIPPQIAESRTSSLFSMMVLSSILSMVFCVSGLLLSYQLNLSSGATIIAVSVAGFLVSAALGRLRRVH
ncbi:metal ABC transporter permease [Maridesulfovibrio salexigens]|uniref:ABC-3 protein n=1 Tax=Maridesulfovibrio salexigens (strain ATCC 14822 / DSM 2638 / NCIMB 8403 / VKM B-1763) TaxID=526222 RepID=C6C0L1_MARSD|nr:metal ABC transporter permease [Maridesulfovibrio salexigens]ACS79145.1 ABC-3 protein [Maridesulfovibrio salexigens DSM 2638]